ncbi:MAG: hypothetical protein WD070_09925 [Pirellulaceae bacterium]
MDCTAQPTNTDVMMRRRPVISLLSLAGLSLLHGCADSSAPSQVKRGVGPTAPSRNTVVAAAHYEPAPSIKVLPNKPAASSRPSAPPRSYELRRLPPVYPVAALARSAPATAVLARRLERTPGLNCVDAVEQRSYAIDLTAREALELTPPAVSILPSIVKAESEREASPDAVVPQKRIVAAKPPKPPLPPLATQSAAAPSGSAGWLTTGSSLVAVSQRADGMIDRGFLLAEKGAYYSAKTEFEQALRTVAQALDAHFGGSDYSAALAAGWLALDEAKDFSAHRQRGLVVDVGLMVESHQSPILKDYALDKVSPVVAMQHYFAFAQERLVEAGGHAPVASRALHGLGKIHMVLGEKSGSAERLHGPKALAFQQAALTTDPGNFLAANELGVLLARFGKLQEARTVLQYSVATYPLPETWQNLSVVHQRLGEAELAAQSLANWQLAIQQTGGNPATQQANGRSLVQWVPPQAFVEQQPGAAHAPTMPPPAVPHEQAKRKSGFLWW